MTYYLILLGGNMLMIACFGLGTCDELLSWLSLYICCDNASWVICV